MIRLWKNEDVTALVFYANIRKEVVCIIQNEVNAVFDEQVRLCARIMNVPTLWREA